MKAHNQPTLDDVARRAGVSTATVSRCLNTPSVVRDGTRERVLSAVATLGYTPHFAARALASNRTRSIGAVIPTMDNAIFARGLQAMEEELALSGVTLLVATSGYDPERERQQIGALIARGVDGVLLIGDARPEESYALLATRGLPFVLAWAWRDQPGRIYVGFDNRAAARRMTETVLEHGHRRIAMISGPTAWNDRAADRVAGVRDALGAHGLALPDHWLAEARYDFDDAGAAFGRVMSGVHRPTAIICGNDVIAVGALRAAKHAGQRVPEDVSIVGFDDIDLAEVVDPPLTTVRVPHRRMGRAAARVLLGLSQSESGATSGALIETELRLRKSLGRIG